MIQLFILLFVAIPLLKLVAALAWPGLLRRREGQRAEDLLVRQFGEILDDPRMSTVGTRLLDTATMKASFGVLRGPIKNAVALPSGRILVWQGLLDETSDDDDMLAGVLAHELGHLRHEHFLKRVQWAALARFVLGSIGGGWMRSALQGAVATLIARGFSRTQELEADRAAVEIMADAGFNPGGLARLLDLLATTHHPGGLMGTHPEPSDRAARVRELIGIPTAPDTPEPPPADVPDNVLLFPARPR
jgi:Zn-dependent protease with chaperone function